MVEFLVISAGQAILELIFISFILDFMCKGSQIAANCAQEEHRTTTTLSVRHDLKSIFTVSRIANFETTNNNTN